MIRILCRRQPDGAAVCLLRAVRSALGLNPVSQAVVVLHKKSSSFKSRRALLILRVNSRNGQSCYSSGWALFWFSKNRLEVSLMIFLTGYIANLGHTERMNATNKRGSSSLKQTVTLFAFILISSICGGCHRNAAPAVPRPIPPLPVLNSAMSAADQQQSELTNPNNGELENRSSDVTSAILFGSHNDCQTCQTAKQAKLRIHHRR